MKSIILMLVLVAAGVVGLGLYLGWFEFSSGSDDSKANVQFSVDKDKIREDKDKAVDAVKDMAQPDEDKPAEPAPKAPDQE